MKTKLIKEQLCAEPPPRGHINCFGCRRRRQEGDPQQTGEGNNGEHAVEVSGSGSISWAFGRVVNMQTLTLADVMDVMEESFPHTLAQSWDSVGLICGDPEQPVRTILCALDPVAATVSEALDLGADLLLTHHPLYLRGTSTVGAHTPKGALIHQLIKANCALFNAHTNGDSAAEGTAVVLAELLGLDDIQPVEPDEKDPQLGLGRYGRLPRPCAAGELAQHLADILPGTARGVALGGDAQRMIETVAVCPGAGDSSLDRVRELGVDAMVTSDLRHHPASEALAHRGAPVLLETAHFATESPWMARTAEVLRREARERNADLTVHVSHLNTDPWAAIYLRKDPS